MITKEKERRMPRPWGTTHLASTYHASTQPPEKQELKQKLIEHTLSLYLTNKLNLNGKIYSIEELALALNEEPNIIQEALNKIMLKRGTMFDDTGKGAHWARVIFSNSIFQALEIQAQVQHQVSVLAAQQGTKYVPFLSSTLNQALGNLIIAQKPLQELMKLMVGNAPTSIYPAVQEIDPTQATAFITPERAMKMIQDNGPSLLESSELTDLKEAELGTLPQVNARYQNLESIGIRATDMKIPLDSEKVTSLSLPKLPNQVPISHETRRERGHDIMDEASDFIA